MAEETSKSEKKRRATTATEEYLVGCRRSWDEMVVK